MIPVTGGLPEGALHNLRGHDFNIVPLLMDAAPIVNEGIAKDHALGKIEGEAGCLITEGKKPQLTPETTMVTALGLFNAGEIGIQLFLLREGNAVDSLQGLPRGIPSPVGGVAGSEFDAVALDAPGGIQVRTGTKIGELSLTVETDGHVIRQVVDKLYFIGLIALFHKADGFFPREFKALYLQLLFADLAHLGFDFLHNLRRKSKGRIHIVVKTVINGRADGKLYFRIEALDRLCQNMRAGMPVGMPVLFVFKGVSVFVFFHFLFLPDQ